LYLLAGGVLVVYATLNGLEAFTAAAFEQKVFEAGYIAGFLGLLGLYPRVADRRPWLARVGAVTAVFGLIAFSAFTAQNVAELAGLASGDIPGWTLFTVMAASGFVVGYLAFGVAVLRSKAYSRLVGVFLLVPGVIIVLMLLHIAAGLASPGTVFVVSAGQAMAHLAIGATLRAEAEGVEGEDVESEEAEPATDATARG
jgi:hypothetical protein